jgi:hypothetical protein
VANEFFPRSLLRNAQRAGEENSELIVVPMRPAGRAAPFASPNRSATEYTEACCARIDQQERRTSEALEGEQAQDVQEHRAEPAARPRLPHRPITPAAR